MFIRSISRVEPADIYSCYTTVCTPRTAVLLYMSTTGTTSPMQTAAIDPPALLETRTHYLPSYCKATEQYNYGARTAA